MIITAYMDRLYYDMKTSSNRNEQNVTDVHIAIYVAGKLATDGFHVTVKRFDSNDWQIVILKRP